MYLAPDVKASMSPVMGMSEINTRKGRKGRRTAAEIHEAMEVLYAGFEVGVKVLAPDIHEEARSRHFQFLKVFEWSAQVQKCSGLLFFRRRGLMHDYGQTVVTEVIFNAFMTQGNLRDRAGSSIGIQSTGNFWVPRSLQRVFAHQTIGGLIYGAFRVMGMSRAVPIHTVFPTARGLSI